MVTFRPVGRMGNFLFEAATSLAYALKHNLEFTIPIETNDEVWNPIYLKHLQNKRYDKLLHEIVLLEKGHEYGELEFKEEWRSSNIRIAGYRQSEKYFLEYRDEILSMFNFPYKKNEGVVSVHVRRGDYLKYPTKHPVVTERYLNESIEHFVWMGYKKFKFHSDDMPWVKEFKSNYNIEIEYSEGKNEVEDLISMSECEHQICSNSTLAWWGWWLNRNENKKTVMPITWFGIDNSHLKTHDIYPDKNCVKL